MPRTVQVRDLSDATYLALRARAASAGATLQEYLRAELTAMAVRLDPAEALRRQQALVAASGLRPTREQVLEAVREGRRE